MNPSGKPSVHAGLLCSMVNGQWPVLQAQIPALRAISLCIFKSTTTPFYFFYSGAEAPSLVLF
jgi:hypothetical protein